MKNPLTDWIDSLPKREPPYDEFFDRHTVLLWIVMIAGSLLALLIAVGLVLQIWVAVT